MFAEAAEDTTTARLVYELPDGAGVRIVGDDELTDTRAALKADTLRCARNSRTLSREPVLAVMLSINQGLGRIEVFERRRKYPFGTGSARAISSNRTFSASLRASSASDAMPFASFALMNSSLSYSLCVPCP